MIINANNELRLIICSNNRSLEDYKIVIDLKDINTILEM